MCIEWAASSCSAFNSNVGFGEALGDMFAVIGGVYSRWPWINGDIGRFTVKACSLLILMKFDCLRDWLLESQPRFRENVNNVFTLGDSCDLFEPDRGEWFRLPAREFYADEGLSLKSERSLGRSDEFFNFSR